MKYFITNKKLSRRQTHYVEFLLGFNFFISYTLDRENGKVDLFALQPNECLADDQND